MWEYSSALAIAGTKWKVAILDGDMFGHVMRMLKTLLLVEGGDERTYVKNPDSEESTAKPKLLSASERLQDNNKGKQKTALQSSLRRCRHGELPLEQ